MSASRTVASSSLLAAFMLAAIPTAALTQEVPDTEEELRAHAPPPPSATRFGDGTRGRIPDVKGEPVEPALSLETSTYRERPGGQPRLNASLRATLSSTLALNGAPALVYAPELRLAAIRAFRAAGVPPEPGRRPRIAAPIRARAAAGDSGPPRRAAAGARPARRPAEGPDLGAVLDPVGGLDLPPEMPAIRWPIFVDGSCTGNQPGTSLWEARRAWARAHHNVWRAYQLLEFIGESPGQFRDEFWSDGYRTDDGDANWSPYQWFGSYAGYRQSAIREVVAELWDRFRSGDFDGIAIRVKCPTPQNEPNNPGNICFTHEPPAHHVVKGYVNLCEDFFDQEEGYRALTLAHELLHHARVTWKQDDLWKGRFLGDTHLHGHGDTCLEDVKWQKMYGVDRVRHLAGQADCWHRNIAMRNNDNYAWFVTRLGDAVRTGKLKKFPTEGTPWQTPGGTGNECSTNPVPPPGEDFQDPEDCFKAGGEKICPGSGGGGGGAVLPDACLATPMGPGG